MKTIIPPTQSEERIAFGDSRLLDRIWAKTRLNAETGCWEWTGKTNERGYGYIQIGRQSRRAHRVAYEAFLGEVPDGLVLDHLCRVRNCMNPAHLEPVSHAENVRRGEAPSRRSWKLNPRSHCPQGHPYDEANAYIRPNGRRMCRACAQARKRRYRQEKRQAGMQAAVAGGAR